MYKCTGMYNGWFIINELWCKLDYSKFIALSVYSYCTMGTVGVISGQLLRKVELAKIQDRLMDES